MNKQIKKNRMLKIGLSVLGGLLILLILLNISGRSHFNPQGLNEAQIIQDTSLVPGINDVQYISNGDIIKAHLFLPEDYEEGEKWPTIVVTPPHTGVKEQTAGIYAEKLSEKGFITLVFDPRGFGESEGHRGYLSSYRQIEDLRNAIDYVMDLNEVDVDNVFNLGMCAGSGVSAYETAMDSRIKSLAVVSPYLTGSEQNGGDSFIAKNIFYIVNGVSKLQRALTGSEVRMPLVPTTEEEAEGVNAITKGMMTYYLPGKPGNVPTWSNDVSMFSFVPVLGFSIFEYDEEVDRVPTYVVYGDEAVSKDGAIRFYDMVDGQKDRLVLEGAGHFDVYWKPEFVNPAVEGINAFFRKSM